MSDPQDNSKRVSTSARKVRRSSAGNKNLSLTLLHVLMEYRESSVYQWVKKHPGISLMLVSLWGMFIIVMFIWFVFSRVVQTG